MGPSSDSLHSHTALYKMFIGNIQYKIDLISNIHNIQQRYTQILHSSPAGPDIHSSLLGSWRPRIRNGHPKYTGINNIIYTFKVIYRCKCYNNLAINTGIYVCDTTCISDSEGKSLAVRSRNPNCHSETIAWQNVL